MEHLIIRALGTNTGTATIFESAYSGMGACMIRSLLFDYC